MEALFQECIQRAARRRAARCCCPATSWPRSKRCATGSASSGTAAGSRERLVSRAAAPHPHRRCVAETVQPRRGLDAVPRSARPRRPRAAACSSTSTPAPSTVLAAADVRRGVRSLTARRRRSRSSSSGTTSVPRHEAEAARINDPAAPGPSASAGDAGLEQPSLENIEPPRGIGCGIIGRPLAEMTAFGRQDRGRHVLHRLRASIALTPARSDRRSRCR